MPPKIVDYDVIVGKSLAGMIEDVNDAIKGGWQPFGAPYTAIDPSDDAEYHYQAVVRYE